MISMLRWAGCALLAFMVWAPAAPVAATTLPCADAGQSDVTTSVPQRPVTQSPATREHHVVARGDSLSLLAARLDVPGGWRALYAANRQVVGPEPDVLRPGTRLVLPARAPVVIPRKHQVTSGDTLTGLAERFDLSGGWRALYAANRAEVGSDPDALRPGTTLALPGPTKERGTDRRAQAPKAPSAPESSTEEPARSELPAVSETAIAAMEVSDAASAPDRATPPDRGNSAGLPDWLDVALVTVGLVALVATVIEPRRRRRRQAGGAPGAASVPVSEGGS